MIALFHHTARAWWVRPRPPHWGRAWVRWHLTGLALGLLPLNWALVLSRPGDLLAGPSFAPLHILPEAVWQAIMWALWAGHWGPALLALGRLAHYRPIRVATAALSAAVWLGLGAGLAQGPAVTTGPGNYLGLGLLYLARVVVIVWAE